MLSAGTVVLSSTPARPPMGTRTKRITRLRNKASSTEGTKLLDADSFILVMGPTGAGKSTFINIAAGTECVAVGKGLHSCTTDIQTILVTHPENRQRIVFIDSPGFDATWDDDTVILERISDWLARTYEEGTKLAGILYLYEISQERMLGSYSMFTELCGDDAMKNVVLVTTKWSRVELEEGGMREEQLKMEFWKGMLNKGAVTARFMRTRDSAWDIVDQLVSKNRPRTLRIQEELIDHGMSLPETTAGKTLWKYLQNMLPVYKKRKATAAHTSSNEPSRSRNQSATKQRSDLGYREETSGDRSDPGADDPHRNGGSSTGPPNNEVFILIMGLPGAGKSTFINNAAGTERVAVGHNLRSCTTDIQTVPVNHPGNGHRIVFIDTPGFDDTWDDDAVILKRISHWLARIYEEGTRLAGILYLYEISQERMRGTFLKNRDIFTKLCGDDAMKNVMLVTTKWTKVELDEGEKREEQLKTEFWQDMLDKGAVTARFMLTRDSAWEIVDRLVPERKAQRNRVEHRYVS